MNPTPDPEAVFARGNELMNDGDLDGAPGSFMNT